MAVSWQELKMYKKVSFEKGDETDSIVSAKRLLWESRAYFTEKFEMVLEYK